MAVAIPNAALIEYKLRRITKRQCQILYWIGRSLNYRDIGNVIGYDEDTVQADMTALYRYLGLTGLTKGAKQELLKETICPIHDGLVRNPETDCAQWITAVNAPQPDPTILQEVIEDAEKGLLPLDPEKRALTLREMGGLIKKSPRELTAWTVPRKPTRVILPWILVTLPSVLLVVVLLILLLRDNRGPSQQAPVALATVIETQPIVITATPIPITPSPIAITQAPPVATQPAANSIPPTQVRTPTSTFTPTSTPTATPLPSFTPIPSVPLPFRDNFSNGLRPEWKVLTGQYAIVGNRLQGAGGDVTLRLQYDASRYAVEFNYSIGVNTQFFLTFADQLRVAVNTVYYYAQWEARQGNQWVVITHGEPLASPAHFRLLVNGNRYTISIDSKPYLDMTYGTPLTGTFDLTVTRGANIGNFSFVAQ